MLREIDKTIGEGEGEERESKRESDYVGACN